MSESTSRLNLIQRAMQRVAVSREAVSIAGDVLQQPSEPPQDATSSQNRVNGGRHVRVDDAQPDQVVREGEPVHLDYARLRASRIISPDHQDSLTYHEFRSLKRKLIPITRDPGTGAMTRNVVMVTSALPQEGKTFTVMNLVISLAAESNLNVIVVDGDVVHNAIAHYFRGEEQDGLVELLTGKRDRIEEVLHPCAELPGLYVVFAGKRHQATPELLASSRMAEICVTLSKRFKESIVLFDMPPVLAASEPTALAAHAHHLIMLIAAGQATRHQVEAALTEVSCCPSISLLFNRSPEWERPLSEPYSYYGARSERAASDLAGESLVSH